MFSLYKISITSPYKLWVISVHNLTSKQVTFDSLIKQILSVISSNTVAFPSKL